MKDKPETWGDVVLTVLALATLAVFFLDGYHARRAVGDERVLLTVESIRSGVLYVILMQWHYHRRSAK